MEVIAALGILALVTSTALVVINRCVASATESTLRMQAFEVARENLEKLVASSSVKEAVEYGNSDRYPDIKWETVVETFYEPLTNRMWVRGVCSAEYEDMQGETQKVELTHWLTDVTKQQLLQLAQQDEAEAEQVAGELIETIEEAAEYAGVDVETIEKWLEEGMAQTEDGSFVKDNLDLYARTGGKPSDEEKDKQVTSTSELLDLAKGTVDSQDQGASMPGAPSGEVDPTTGLTQEELEAMDFQEVFELLKKKQGKEF